MSKILIVATVVVALVLIAASPVSADWFVEREELTGTAALASTAKVDKENVLKAEGVTISCSGTALNSAAPDLVESRKITASSITFTGCKASSPCSLAKSEIKTESVVAELTTEGAVADGATLKPKTGTRLSTLTFEGAECALTGEAPLTGQAKALLPTGEEEETVQALSWVTAESSKELKLGSSPASLEGSSLFRLASDKAWSQVPVAFRAAVVGNNSGIELRTKQEGGTTVEFALETGLNRIECAGTGMTNTVTFAALGPFNLPRSSLDMRPTFPAGCTSRIGTENSTAVAVTGCGTFELGSAGSFGFGATCKFALTFPGFANCVVEIPARAGFTGVTYATVGATTSIRSTIAALRVPYNATNCSVGGGSGKLSATLFTEGYNGSPLAQVSIQNS